VTRLSIRLVKSIKKTNAVFKKLSLKAENNWHQNSGANRLDHNNGFDSAIFKNPTHKGLASPSFVRFLWTGDDA
jgi:hypothetical protein